MTLHLWASTRSPAVLASQGRAMPARSVWAVAPSRAARSPTYVGSSAHVMSARAPVRVVPHAPKEWGGGTHAPAADEAIHGVQEPAGELPLPR
eukprot:7989870-Pyramimonas_sp.AAC.1